MTLTENLIDGSGSNTYNFTFPILETNDVRVQLREFDPSQPEGDQIISQKATTAFDVFQNPNRIVFQPIAEDTIYQLANGDVRITSTNGYQVVIRIYRETDIDGTAAYFYPGSAIRAKDLNDNFKQLLFSAQETDAELGDILAGTFPENSIPGYALKDGSVTPDKLDREYVEVTGDNMTGDLTLGTDPSSPAIELNADGTYVGKKSVSVDRTATSNPTFRGKLNGADTFKVLADGSATFAGSQVDFGSSAGAKIRFARPSDGAYSHALGTDLRFDASSDNNKFGLTNSGGGAQINVGLVSNGDSKFSVQTLNPGTALYEEVAAIKYDGSAVFSDSVSIGGTLPSSPNISLNADGSTTFKGKTHEFGNQSATGPQYLTVTSGGAGDAGRFGYGLRNRPFTYSTTSNDANTFLCTGTGGRWSFRQNTDDWTTIGSEVAQIGGDGSATFAGDVSIGGTLPSAPNISLGDDGSISASGQIDFNLTAGEGVRLGSRYEDKTVYVGIDSNDAASTSQSWANSAYIGFESGTEDNILYRVNNYHKFLGANGSEAVVINADTSSTTFAGSVSIGGTLPSSPNISLDADGSATFASTNRAATYIQTVSLTGSPSAGNAGTMLQGGTVLATRGGNINIWEGRAEGSTTITSSIKPDGSATFASDVVINSLTVGLGGGSAVGNVAVGQNALNSNTDGIYNIALGTSALNKNTGGSSNVAIGRLALNSNNTGVSNVAVGTLAGRYIEGSNNTILGAYQGTSADATLNNTVIISAGTNERMRIDSSGDVGIGTTNPQATLDVNGKARSTSTVTGDVGTTLATKDYVDANSGGGGGGGTTINYNGASAWGDIEASGSLLAGLNCTTSYSGSGVYLVVFNTPMPSANYAVNLQADTGASAYISSKSSGEFSVILRATKDQTPLSGNIYFSVFATNALPPTGGTGTDAWATVTSQESNGVCVVPGSFNVASVTRTAKGAYDVLFTTPMPTAAYAVTVGSTSSSASQTRTTDILQKTAAGFTARPKNGAGYQDYDFDFQVNATNATLPATLTTEGALNPTGSVTMFAGATVPSGWLECNGQAAPTALAAVLGQTNVPDLRGEFIRGWDNGRGVDTGRALLSTQDDTVKNHTHTYNVYNNTGGPYNAQQTGSNSFTGTGTTNEGGGGSETRPRNVSLMYIIKT